METLAAIVFGTLRLWSPLALAAMGGVVSERSGVVNLGLEAMLLAGAYGSVAASRATGNAFVGLAAGVVCGAVVGAVHCFLTRSLNVASVLSGVGLNLGLLGLTTFLLRLRGADGLETGARLSPWLGVALASVVVVAVALVLSRTKLGLRLRAAGENPGALESTGVSVGRLRYGALLVSGALGGAGGAILALAGLGAFTENMTAGRGYVALAAVILGRWNPWGTALAALLLGFGDTLQYSLQNAGLAKIVPPDILATLPYVLALVVLLLGKGVTRAPRALK